MYLISCCLVKLRVQIINLVLLFVAFIAPCFPYFLWLVVPVYVVVPSACRVTCKIIILKVMHLYD